MQRPTRFSLFIGMCLSVFLLVGCTRSTSITEVDKHVGRVALEAAEALIQAHPKRIAGEDSQVVAQWIASQIEGATLHPFQTPYGPMCNVFVSETSEPVAILVSHFDTKVGIEGFVGANDGASTTGLLIALAQQKQLPVAYLFLDGEESKEHYSATDGLHGAWFAARGGMLLDRTLPVIVVDMLGDADFTPMVASNGSRQLNRKIYAAAKALGITLEEEGVIIDDHLPFVAEGWQAANIIDFDYGPQNAWWHTTEDTLDKLSVEALATSAALIRTLIERIEEEQKQ